MWALPLLWLAALAVADNNFTYKGTPVAGQPFTITWTPGTYSKVDIMLNSLYPSEEVIITTSDPIATEIDNTGSWVWNVPSDIQGRYSLSIARDYRFLVSYSAPFVFGPYSVSSIAQETSIPQSTACTLAASSPSPTGVNPFIFPSGDEFHVRVGIQSTIKWIPTTSGSISIVLQSGDSAATTANMTIASKIPNSGSFPWTPAPDLANNNGFLLYSYQIVLIDDADPTITSISETIEVLSPSYETDFTGPYVPAVLGQPYQINWSPSITPTISLVLQEDIPVNPPPNTTIGDHIKNSGSFTWQVPSTSTFIVPGVWFLAAIDDATGNLDSRIQITIDATKPPTCGPYSAVYYTISEIYTKPSATGTGTAATPATATNSSNTATSTAAVASFTILNEAATAATDLSPSASTSTSASGGQVVRPVGEIFCFLGAVWALRFL